MNVQGYFCIVTGCYIVDDQVMACPTCLTGRGLKFTTYGGFTRVRGECPNGHVWDESRVPPENVRAVTTGAL